MAPYQEQDGIGTQLGGLSRADGGSPTPDPAYIFGNHTSSWGVEHLSICKIVMLSRFLALSVSRTLKVSLLQT